MTESEGAWSRRLASALWEGPNASWEEPGKQKTRRPERRGISRAVSPEKTGQKKRKCRSSGTSGRGETRAVDGWWCDVRHRCNALESRGCWGKECIAAAPHLSDTFAWYPGGHLGRRARRKSPRKRQGRGADCDRRRHGRDRGRSRGRASGFDGLQREELEIIFFVKPDRKSVV